MGDSKHNVSVVLAQARIGKESKECYYINVSWDISIPFANYSENTHAGKSQ